MDFFRTRPVFTVAEFADWYDPRRTRGARTVEAVLNYHTKRGHVVRVRKGLYAGVPAGATPDRVPVDPYLIAGKLSSDAIIAYHTALEFHGKAHSTTREFFYLTNLAARPVTFRGQRFRAVRPPAALRSKNAELFGVNTVDRLGLDVRVTSLERTLVDVLDRPRFGGGWEEIWQSLEIVEFFDLAKVVEYALLLDNATTAAKVGFFLEQHKQSLMAGGEHLEPLRKHRPRGPHYLSRGNRGGGKLVRDWNLIVPAGLIERRWREVL